MEEYLTVFNAFILGMVTGIFFNNWAGWIQNRKKIIFSLRHLLFTVLVFVLTVDFWWVSFHRVALIISNESLFFLSLVDPILYYIIAIDLFPKLDQDLVNMHTYFARKERLIYALFGFNFLCGIVVSVVLGESLTFDAENIFRFIATGICATAVAVNRKPVFNVLLAAGILLLVLHVVLEGDPPTRVSEEGFSFAEYLTIYMSFFYGFVANLFLSGWAHMVQHIRKIHFGKEYFTWTLFAFALQIDAWWGD